MQIFKAILLGQWHSLSDEVLEHALIVRVYFIVFCAFDDVDVPDHNTLNRFRNWLIREGLLEVLFNMINEQLVVRGLKVEQAKLAVVDASIIESAGKPTRRAYEFSGDGDVEMTSASKSKKAKWVKNNRFYLGYQLHAWSDEEYFIEKSSRHHSQCA